MKRPSDWGTAMVVAFVLLALVLIVMFHTAEVQGERDALFELTKRLDARVDRLEGAMRHFEVYELANSLDKGGVK